MSEICSPEDLNRSSLCDICYMKFNETWKIAKVLHCGHTFCLECVQQIYDHSSSIFISCPACRNETNCLIDDLPVNYSLMENLRKLNLLSKETNRGSKQHQKSEEEQRKALYNSALAEGCRLVLNSCKTALKARITHFQTEKTSNEQILEFCSFLRYTIEVSMFCAEFDDDNQSSSIVNDSVIESSRYDQEESPILMESISDTSNLEYNSTQSESLSDSFASAVSE